ncbi:hypothetical protein, partial [Vreelandella olivaria]|uniref:hypothetical protein n=1 Tax=Vreelandella olivaria TaxID=390919 RepID=UPI00201F3D38
YNTFVANILFSVLAFISLGWAYFMSLLGESLLAKCLLGGGMFTLFILIAMSMTHQTTIIVYRFTESVAEECSWKPQMDAVKPFLKWSAIILMPIVVILMLQDPAFVIAGIGPLGMGLMAWMMGTSKGYQAMQRDYRHREYEWTKTEEIVAWHKRDLIGLRFTYLNEEGGEYSTYSSIFCHSDNFEDNVNYFRNMLPAVPYHERELKVYSNFSL